MELLHRIKELDEEIEYQTQAMTLVRNEYMLGFLEGLKTAREIVEKSLKSNQSQNKGQNWRVNVKDEYLVM